MDKYTSRVKGDKEFKFPVCKRCGKAMYDDCDCIGKHDASSAAWAVYTGICAVIILLALMFVGTAYAEEWVGWSDPRRMEYTPASTLRDDYTIRVKPANLFDAGDIVDCVVIDLEGNVVAREVVKLDWRRLVRFQDYAAYELGALAYCKQG